MRKSLAIGALLAGAIFGTAQRASAQTVLVLPEDSQRATVIQRIGITDITITYHRPLVNGRQIWGRLVPYGKVWRAGADENTTFEVTDPVTIEGQPLPKGTYGLHMIPSEDEWVVIFSKNSTSWGSFTYDEKEDALRVKVKPRSAAPHEALTYEFGEVKPDSTVAVLEWEKLAVPFKVEVNVHEIVQASVKQQMRAWSRWMWEGWDESAQYVLDTKGNLNDALEYANQSIQVEQRFDNLQTKSRILDALGQKEEAEATLKKAISMGSPLQLHSLGRYYQAHGEQQRAFELFRMNVKDHPEEWISHVDAARLAVADGKFDVAETEAKPALAGSPDWAKSQMEQMVSRIQAKEDINK